MPIVPKYNDMNVMPSQLPVGATDLGMTPAMATTGARSSIALGEQIQGAGQQFGAVEIDAAMQANQLRVDDGLNQLKEASLNLRFDPKTGFENAKGIDALQRSSGRSLADEYGDQLQQQASSIAGGLSNDAQRAAFNLHANDIVTGFKGDAKQHEGREFQTYALSVRDGTVRNRMNEIGLNYNNPAVTDQAVRSIQAATYDQARLLGKSAEWAEAQARDATSKAHAVAISTALQNNDATYADMYLKKYAKEMQADDILQVNGSLTKQLNGQLGLATAQNVIQMYAPHISTSEGDRAFNIAIGTESAHRQFAPDGSPLKSSAGAIGIAQVMPDTAKEVATDNGIPWDETKYKTDAAYNANLGKLYFDKQLKAFNGNLAMTYAAYNAGPSATQKALDAAQAEGKPDAWLQKLPAETQDYVTTNMKAFGAGQGQFSKPTLMDIQNTIRREVGPGQPERLHIALDEGERQYKTMNDAIKQRNEESVATAMRGVMENGGRFTGLPAAVRSNIPAEDVAKVMDFAKKVSSGDDTTSLWLYNKLAADPDALKTMGDNEFFALRAELSQSDFKHFSEERGKLISGTAPNGPGDLNTSAISRSLDDRLTSMGVNPKPKSTETDAMAQVGAIRRFINQSVAAEQANRGKKMNDVEIDGFIDTLFAQQGTITHFIGADTKAPLLTQTVSDIPSTTKDALTAAFKRSGIDTPSDADLLNAYWRQMQKIKKMAKSTGATGSY